MLLRAKLVPDRAGADTQVIAHIPLSQLRQLPGARDIEDAWIRARLGEDGYLAGKDAEAAACDAQTVPVVTGTMDPDVIDQIIDLARTAAQATATTGSPQPAAGNTGETRTSKAAGASTTANRTDADHGDETTATTTAADQATATAANSAGTDAPATGAAGRTAAAECETADATAGHASTGGPAAGGPQGETAGQAGRPCPSRSGTEDGTVPQPAAHGPASSGTEGKSTGQAAPHPAGNRHNLEGQTAGQAAAGLPQPPRLSPEAWRALRYAIARLAIDLVSGPGGIASALRRGLMEKPHNTPSLPLDIGYSHSIPWHIRRAVLLRDRTCAWPECDRPAAHCDVHHLRHQRDGGETSVENCILACQYHHDVCIHRRGWQLILHPDGTTEARSPDGRQVLRSHAPPHPHAA